MFGLFRHPKPVDDNRPVAEYVVSQKQRIGWDRNTIVLERAKLDATQQAADIELSRDAGEK